MDDSSGETAQKPTKIAEAQAKLDMAMWQAEASTVTHSELYIWLTEAGLPDEVAIRLRELSDKARKLGGKIIEIGKIILMKIIDFVKRHPNLAIGLAIAAAVSALAASVPLFGILLEPVVKIISVVWFGLIGHRMDKGHHVSSSAELGLAGLTQALIDMARDFLTGFIDVVKVLFADNDGNQPA